MHDGEFRNPSQIKHANCNCDVDNGTKRLFANLRQVRSFTGKSPSVALTDNDLKLNRLDNESARVAAELQ